MCNFIKFPKKVLLNLLCFKENQKFGKKKDKTTLDCHPPCVISYKKKSAQQTVKRDRG